MVVLNGNGNAQGDLFYDDGESIDTIETKSYYHSIYQWSNSDHCLVINVTENNSEKILDTLNIYGLNPIPDRITVHGTQTKYQHCRCCWFKFIDE